MGDIFSKEKRSDIMSKVRSKDSKIEIIFRKALWKEGFRYRKNCKNYFGKPDLVLKKYKTVVFIDSCFWHGCKKHGTLPKTNKKFWINKINANKNRDKMVTKYYRKNNWKIIRIWEHEITKKLDVTIDKITKNFL